MWSGVIHDNGFTLPGFTDESAINRAVFMAFNPPLKKLFILPVWFLKINLFMLYIKQKPSETALSDGLAFKF